MGGYRRTTRRPFIDISCNLMCHTVIRVDDLVRSLLSAGRSKMTKGHARDVQKAHFARWYLERRSNSSQRHDSLQGNSGLSRSHRDAENSSNSLSQEQTNPCSLKLWFAKCTSFVEWFASLVGGPFNALKVQVLPESGAISSCLRATLLRTPRRMSCIHDE